MSLLGYWVERGYVIGRGVGFCWLRDVPWDGCWCSLCNCLVECCVVIGS